MNILKCALWVVAVSAIVAFASSAWAGCNCNVPPAPAAFSGPAMSVGYGGMVPGGGYPGVGYGAGGYGSGAYGVGYGAGGYGAVGATPGTAAGAVGPGPVGPADPSMMPYGGMVATNGPYWAPGGYEPRIGSPAYFYDPTGGQYVVTGNPYYDHFGPGFQRSSVHGHYRFPYYNYRAPWYYPGRAVYNRNTNFAW